MILPALAVVVVLVQLAAFVVSGRVLAGAWAGHERAAAERSARAAGLPLTPAAFAAKYPKPADADDLAAPLILTAAQMEPRDPAWAAWESSDDPSRPLRQNGELPPGDVIDIYRKAAASQRGALDLLDKFDRRLDPLTGGDAAADWPYIRPDGNDLLIARWMPWLNQQRNLANLLRLQTAVQTADGDAAGALRTIRSTLGQARAVADSTMLVETLVSVGIDALAITTLDEWVANLRLGQIGDGPRQVSRGDLRAMIALLLDDAPIRTALARGLAGDVLMGLDTIDHAAAADELIEKVKLPADAGPFAPFQRRLAAESFAWLLRPLIDREAAAYLRYVTQAAEALDAADAPQWIARAPGDAEDRAISDRFAPLPLAKYLFPSVTRAGLAHFRVTARRHRAAAALAVRLYQIDHGGDLPPTLDALVPAYLPAVPRDATAADDVVRYDPARRRLWTAGEDLDDDNGVSLADLIRQDPTLSNRAVRGRYDDVLSLR